MSYLGLAKPIYLIFFVTNRCNGGCNHCFYRHKINSGSKELTLAEIEKIAASIGKLYHLNLTGGEPFLRVDLDEIARIFYKNCRVRSLAIPTNGSDPLKICHLTENLLKKCPRAKLHINVSIDHLGCQHDQIRNFPGLFQQATQTIKSLQGLQAKNLSVGVNLTLSGQNQDAIEEIYCFIKDELKPDLISPLLIRGQTREPETKGIRLGQYKKLIELWETDIKLHKFKGYHAFTLGSLIMARDIVVRRSILESLQTGKHRYNCLAANLGAVIYDNADVYPCENLQVLLGNLRENDYDFKKIWSAAPRKALVEKIKQQSCWCTHECFQGLNILFSPKGVFSCLSKLLRN